MFLTFLLIEQAWLLKKSRPKDVQKKSRQDALQTIFSRCLDIFYPSNAGCFAETGLFRQPNLGTRVFYRQMKSRRK